VKKLKPWKRYGLVAASPAAKDLSYKQFLAWHGRYYHFIEALQDLDRRLAIGLDFGLRHSQNRDIESGIEEKQDAIAPTECADDGGYAVGQAPRESPEQPTGELPPPKESQTPALNAGVLSN